MSIIIQPPYIPYLSTCTFLKNDSNGRRYKIECTVKTAARLPFGYYLLTVLTELQIPNSSEEEKKFIISNRINEELRKNNYRRTYVLDSGVVLFSFVVITLLFWGVVGISSKSS